MLSIIFHEMFNPPHPGLQWSIGLTNGNKSAIKMSQICKVKICYSQVLILSIGSRFRPFFLSSVIITAPITLITLFHKQFMAVT